MTTPLHSNSNSGQVVLVVLLTMLVGLTIAFGVFLNSLSDVSNIGTEERSEKAFTAAEAAIEKLLKENTGDIVAGPSTVTVADNMEVKVEAEKMKLYETLIKQNSIATIQLGTANTTKRVKVSWTKKADSVENPSVESCSEGNPMPAGLLVDKWLGDGTVEQYAYNASKCPNVITVVNGSATNADDISGSSDFVSSVTIDVTPGSDLLLRIRPIYNMATVRVEATDDGTGFVGDLPDQQIKLVSTAADPDSNETRAIEVNKTNPDLPEIFDYVLYSGKTLVK